jgi:hypothetical protein
MSEVTALLADRAPLFLGAAVHGGRSIVAVQSPTQVRSKRAASAWPTNWNGKAGFRREPADLVNFDQTHSSQFDPDNLYAWEV